MAWIFELLFYCRAVDSSWHLSIRLDQQSRTLPGRSGPRYLVQVVLTKPFGPGRGKSVLRLCLILRFECSKRAGRTPSLEARQDGALWPLSGSTRLATKVGE